MAAMAPVGSSGSFGTTAPTGAQDRALSAQQSHPFSTSEIQVALRILKNISWIFQAD